MKEGDKVKCNGKYEDLQRRFGDTVQTVIAVGKLPGTDKPLVWLKCGGGCFCADGFTVVEGSAGGAVKDLEKAGGKE